MSNYYFVSSSLPEIRIGSTPDINFTQLSRLLKDNLTSLDLEKTRIIRRLYDLYNIRALWLGESLDPHGNYSELELEESLIARTNLPLYVFEYLDKYESSEDRVLHFSELINRYFETEIARSEGFLKKYLIFERDWRYIFAAFRAKKMGRDIIKEFQFENPNVDLIAQIIAQKDAKEFIPPYEYEELKPLFNANQDSPLDLQMAIDRFRFSKIEDLLGVDMFSLDRILGYMAQLILVEDWLKLDKEKGQLIIQNIAKSAS